MLRNKIALEYAQRIVFRTSSATDISLNCSLIQVLINFLPVWMWGGIHSGQTCDTCAVFAITEQRKCRELWKISNQVQNLTPFWKLELFTLLLFYYWVCVQNEVTAIHKFYRRETRFAKKYFVHRFLTKFTFVNVWTDSNVKGLKKKNGSDVLFAFDR